MPIFILANKASFLGGRSATYNSKLLGFPITVATYPLLRRRRDIIKEEGRKEYLLVDQHRCKTVNYFYNFNKITMHFIQAEKTVARRCLGTLCGWETSRYRSPFLCFLVFKGDLYWAVLQMEDSFKMNCSWAALQM